MRAVQLDAIEPEPLSVGRRARERVDGDATSASLIGWPTCSAVTESPEGLS